MKWITLILWDCIISLSEKLLVSLLWEIFSSLVYNGQLIQCQNLTCAGFPIPFKSILTRAVVRPYGIVTCGIMVTLVQRTLINVWNKYNTEKLKIRDKLQMHTFCHWAWSILRFGTHKKHQNKIDFWSIAWCSMDDDLLKNFNILDVAVFIQEAFHAWSN